jgi:hypothetical protein
MIPISVFLITKTNGWFAENCMGGTGAHINIMTAAGKEAKRLIKFYRSQWQSVSINAAYCKMAAAT